MFDLIILSFFETVLMVLISAGIGLIFGIPLGAFLFSVSKQKIYPILSLSINTLRSIPYIILVILMIPLTRFFLNTSIGTIAATFPLSIASILLITRAMEEAMMTVPQDLFDIGYKATSFQKLRHIVFPESLPIFSKSMIGIMINLIGFSAMSGTVGGGGLGDLAFRYGYQRYDVPLIFIVVGILIMLVQCVQFLGNRFYAHLYN